MIHKYSLKMDINVKRQHLSVKGSMTYCHQNIEKQSIKLYLHKDFLNIKISGANISRFEFDTSGAPLGFLACSRPLEIFLAVPIHPGEALTFDFEYHGTLTFDGFPIGSISDEFTELGFYAPVFPVTENMSNAYFDLDIKDDGNITFIHADLNEPLFDFALLGSKYYKNQVVKRTPLTVYYTLESDETKANNILTMSEMVLNYYERLFGPCNQGELNIVITPRRVGGGYCRKGLIVLSTDVSETLFSEDIFGYLAHELAHMWWLNASINTYEDWLNESFAEFSRLLVCKEKFGAEWYSNKLTKYKETYANTPPIIGLDRNNPKAFDVLYKKGSALLCDTFNGFEYSELQDFFHRVNMLKIGDTVSFLRLLEDMYGCEFRESFETKLRGL